jgi:hypothetical protein
MDLMTIVGGAAVLFFVYGLYELDRRVRKLEADNRDLKGQVQWLHGECKALRAQGEGINALRASSPENIIGPATVE